MSGPNGHVPVGTGSQLPGGVQPYYHHQQQPVVGRHGHQGQPARQVPQSVRGVIESRTRYAVPTRPVVVVTAQHQADREYRQVPGTNSVVKAYRGVHQ